MDKRTKRNQIQTYIKAQQCKLCANQPEKPEELSQAITSTLDSLISYHDDETSELGVPVASALVIQYSLATQCFEPHRLYLYDFANELVAHVEKLPLDDKQKDVIKAVRVQLDHC